MERSQANLAAVTKAVNANEWLHFLAQEEDTISNTSICLTVDADAEQVTQMVKLLEAEGVAFDIKSYRDAPAGIRIWGGATVEASDVAMLMDWLVWAYSEVTK